VPDKQLPDKFAAVCGRALRVTAYTGGKSVPSARFRVRQYIPALKALGIDVRERWAKLGSYPPANKALRALWGAAAICERSISAAGSFLSDVTLLQREMLSTFVTAEPLTKPPRALDVDDAIWLYGDGAFARRLARLCDLVVCGNEFLAEQFHHWNSNIHILPTGVDTDRYQPLDPVRAGRQQRIGWCGSGSTLHYLQALTPVFRTLLERRKDVKLRIVADARPAFDGIAENQVEFVRWSAEAEVKAIQEMSIGLMPLDDTPWARGKCSFKLLTYMACGVPVVASPVGMNVEVLGAGGGLAARGHDEWIDAIDSLLGDEEAAKRAGERGRQVVLRDYSLRALTPRLARILRSCS
jgi:glycosyltransferase involved in cell wall biosynthesis